MTDRSRPLVTALIRLPREPRGARFPILGDLDRAHSRALVETFFISEEPSRENFSCSTWAQRIEAPGVAGLNEGLKRANGDWVSLFDSSDRIFPEWFDILAKERDADVLYGDSLLIDPETGRGCRFFFRPDWSPELHLGFPPYLRRGVAMRREIAIQAGGFREGFPGSEDFELLLRATEQTAAIRHVSRPLFAEAWSKDSRPRAGEKAAIEAALERRLTPGRIAEVSGPASSLTYRIRRRFSDTFVSIIIPTRDRVDLLRPCVESVRANTALPHEILIVDNQTRDEETLGYLANHDGPVLRFAQEFNFAEMNNLAARHARGEFLLLLNNDTVVNDPDWLPALLEYAFLPEVGAVGAKLHHPRGTLQHAGVVFQSGARADHLLSGCEENAVDHPYFLRTACEVSAVTGACMMIRRELFLRLGGLDPNLRVAYNDIDLCLRLRQLGYKILFTPFCSVTHHECASRDWLPPLADELIFRSRWSATPLDGDPYLLPVCRSLGYSVAIAGGVHVRTELDQPLSRDGGCSA